MSAEDFWLPSRGWTALADCGGISSFVPLLRPTATSNQDLKEESSKDILARIPLDKKKKVAEAWKYRSTLVLSHARWIADIT